MIVNMMEIFRIIKWKEMVYYYLEMEWNMKEIFLIIKCMVKGI